MSCKTKIFYVFLRYYALVPTKKMTTTAALGLTSSPRSKRDGAFVAAYATLNTAQKKAVDTIEGPVLVLAGPGTGKTQVLALRVANILRSTHARPANILCLTFSKSGASAMRNRLRETIGADAYGVTVNTLHGFCNDIIVQNPSVFEQWSTLHQITDVERYRELNKIIDQSLPDLALVNLKSPHSRTQDILSRISQLKREGTTDPAFLKSVADQYESELSQKSGPETKAHEQNLLKARKFHEFTKVFAEYQAMLQRTGRYDYEDMILTVIAALEREDWLLASLQERYQYILVDEFQDTNGAQYQLIDTLAKDRTGDNAANVFVVGDDDQAIYRFQGANIHNIMAFHQRFPKAPVIALTTSYRCTQPILDAAGALISHNTERLVGRIEGLSKDLTSAVKEKGSPQPTLIRPASDMSEPWLIADLVSERLAAGTPPEEISVIVQTNAELLPLYDVFKARAIPVQLSGKLDLLVQPLVEQAVCILKAVHHPESSAALANALACECFHLHPADIGRLQRARRAQSRTMLDVLLDVRTLLETEPTLHIEDIERVRDLLLSIHQKVPSRTVVQTLEAVYRECGLFKGYQRGDIDIMEFAAAQEFFNRVSERAAEEPHFSFAIFMNDLEYYEDPDFGDVRLRYDIPHLTRAGVQLMTAHKSKGLEFHTVIMANFCEGHWDKRRNPPSLSVPEDLLFQWTKDQQSYQQNQDERRVAYVAMTRAKRELIFTCPRELTSGDTAKAVSPSSFFAEAGDLPEVDREVADPGSMSTLLVEPVRSFDEEYEAFLREKLEHFSLSPTALNTFLNDPKEFLEVHLLERPETKDVRLSYGNAVHHALASWANKIMTGAEVSEAEFVERFTNHLETKERDVLTDAERARIEHIGKQALPRYFQKQLQPPHPLISKVEFALKARLGDIPIKGKIDRMDIKSPTSASVIVRDYKTGKPKTEKQSEEYGYIRQLAFYAVLLELAQPLLKPEAFILDFVGEGIDGPIERVFAIGDKDKAELKKLIEQVWAKITALDFTPL